MMRIYHDDVFIITMRYYPNRATSILTNSRESANEGSSIGEAGQE